MILSHICFISLVFALVSSTAPAVAASAQPCGPESAKSGQTLKVNGSDVMLHAGPSAKSEKLINQKATQILKKTQYLTIDNTVTVVEECNQTGWSRVRVTEPDWLCASHIGWVPNSALRGQKKDSSGQVVFTEADFIWDKKTTPYKKIIVAGVNKVHKENSRCETIDPASAYISSSKGTPSDPVFFVTCGTGANTFNAFFSKSEVEKGTKLAAAKHIDRNRAIDLCEAYAKANATHPSTVSFSRVMDLAVTDHPNGRTAVTSSFTAKNSFDLKLKYSIRCLCDASGLIEGNINEAQ
jgi:hypothetical protein